MGVNWEKRSIIPRPDLWNKIDNKICMHAYIVNKEDVCFGYLSLLPAPLYSLPLPVEQTRIW